MPDPRAVSLNHRLRNAASAEGVTIERFRNRVVFQRILARLAHQDAWVLKGGFCLEVRLGLAARATRDLDLSDAMRRACRSTLTVVVSG